MSFARQAAQTYGTRPRGKSRIHPLRAIVCEPHEWQACYARRANIEWNRPRQLREKEGAMKIVHCIATLSNGGAERQLSILAKAQQARGDEVHVLFTRTGHHHEALKRTNVTLHKMDVRHRGDLSFLLRVSRRLRAIKPDVVQTWLPMMDFVAGPLALFHGWPWVMTERSCESLYADRLRNRIVRPMMGRFADAIVANSASGHEMWLQHQAPVRVRLIRNAVPFAQIAAMKAVSLTAVGGTDGENAVIYVGRLAAEKNIPLLLEVVDRVTRTSNTMFIICGDGPMAAEVEAFIRTRELKGRVRFLGLRTDVLGLLKASAAFVSTSAFEGQPNAVLEAIACECPLVVSDIAAHREFLDDDSAKIVPLKAEAYVTAINDVLRDRVAARVRAGKAKEMIATLSPEFAANAYSEVYQAVIRSRR